MTREYLERDPENWTILQIHGLTQHLMEQYRQSISTFEQLRKLGDTSYGVHYYLGLNHYMMKNWPQAIPELEAAYQIEAC